MTDRKSKLLIYSPNNHFLEDLIAPLSKSYDVQISTTAEMSLFLAREWSPEFCLIDMDSKEEGVLSSLRQSYHHLKMGVVAFSQNSQKEETAFRLGADHFLSSSTAFPPLHWRLTAIQKRNTGAHTPHKNNHQNSHEQRVSSITLGPWRIFPNDYLIKKDNQVISNTPTQFNLLMAFITHRDQLLSREWLKEYVWENAQISPRSIDAQISKLKKLLPELDRYLSNVYGKGYIFSIPDGEASEEFQAA